MKIQDVLSESNIIDFSKYKKDKPAKTVNVDADLNKSSKTMNMVRDHLDLLTDWVEEFKNTIKLPRFDNMDDVFLFLIKDLGIPFLSDQGAVNGWYKKQQPETKSKIQMIVHHSKRLNKALDIIESKLNEFIHSVPTNVEMPMDIKFIKAQIKSDRTILQKLEQLASQ